MKFSLPVFYHAKLKVLGGRLRDATLLTDVTIEIPDLASSDCPVAYRYEDRKVRALPHGKSGGAVEMRLAGDRLATPRPWGFNTNWSISRGQLQGALDDFKRRARLKGRPSGERWPDLFGGTFITRAIDEATAGALMTNKDSAVQESLERASGLVFIDGKLHIPALGPGMRLRMVKDAFPVRVDFEGRVIPVRRIKGEIECVEELDAGYWMDPEGYLPFADREPALATLRAKLARETRGDNTPTAGRTWVDLLPSGGEACEEFIRWRPQPPTEVEVIKFRARSLEEAARCWARTGGVNFVTVLADLQEALSWHTGSEALASAAAALACEFDRVAGTEWTKALAAPMPFGVNAPDGALAP